MLLKLNHRGNRREIEDEHLKISFLNTGEGTGRLTRFDSCKSTETSTEYFLQT